MIDNRQQNHETHEIEKLIELVVEKVLEYEKIMKNCQVSVILVDNDAIGEINNIYRKIDSPTDVLSFPMHDFQGDYDIDIHGYEDVDIDTGELILGDIAISLEKAYEQSKEYGHSFNREVAYLTVHGMLHLLGYDHEEEEDKKIMRDREESILNIINMSR